MIEQNSKYIFRQAAILVVVITILFGHVNIVLPQILLAGAKNHYENPAYNPGRSLHHKSDSINKKLFTPVFIPGDAVKITVFPDTSGFPNGIYNIDDNGFIDLPIIGMTKITNMTEKELVDSLNKKYATFLRYPNIQIRPLIRVSILGGVFKPGLYWVPAKASFWDVVHIAGGTTREDGIKKIRWERDRMIVKYDLVPFFESGQSLASMGFKSGDQLWVTHKPKNSFWDMFKSDVIPILTFLSTSIVTVLTLETLLRNR